jgi:hypothetical protein
VRLLVLGSSSSAGVGHADPQAVAWPWLAGRALEEALGRPVEVAHLRIVPVGPRPVPMAMQKVDAFEPDVVVFSFGAVLCAVASVSDRIRQVFGHRAYSWFRKAELRFDSVTGNTAVKPRRIARVARWMGRHTIGVATVATYDEVSGVQAEILHQLSRREGLVVVVACEPDLPSAVVRDNPQANAILNRLRKQIEGIGRDHHFLIADYAPRFDIPDRDDMYLVDAMHKSVRGHRAQADVVAATLLSAPSPFAV